MSALDDFFGDGNTIQPTTVPIELQAVIETWQAEIAQNRIGFLPRLVNGRLYWYGFAPSPRERRELLDLLDGWIGPTYSDLGRTRGDLDLHDPFDADLRQLPTPPLRFEVLPRVAPGSTHARQEVRDALQMMSRLIKSRPSSEFDAPRTTVEVLDDLGHAISALDRRVALACLRELEATADLDQTNLAFLRLRMYAGLHDWAAIMADQDLPHILAMRRPLGVTRVIQRAVYATHCEAADVDGRDVDLVASVADLPNSFQALATGAVTRRRSDVVLEFLLALHSANPTPTLTRLLGEAERIEAGLADRLHLLMPSDVGRVRDVEVVEISSPQTRIDETAPAVDPDESPATDPESSLQLAIRQVRDGELHEAFATGRALPPSPDVASLLLFCARELESEEVVAEVTGYLDTHGLRDVLAAGDIQQREALAWLDEFGRPEKTLGWLGWFERLSEDANQLGPDVDPEVSARWEPLERTQASQLLFGCSETALGRFGERGGQFMAAHRNLFVEDGAGELIERVLACLAIGAKNSAGARVQTLALLDHLAEGSPTTAIVSSALEWAGEIVSINISAVATTWAVDVLQTATSGPSAVAMAAKHQLFYGITGLIRPFKSALDLTDLEALKIIAEELGVDVPDDLLLGTVDDVDPAAPYRYLEDQTVVLYSLTESATTRAAQVLRRMVPGLDVKTSAEHDGSPKLAAQSANADIFVMVAASAKHAATDFIKANRAPKSLIQVNSRGTSAILRALAEG